VSRPALRPSRYLSRFHRRGALFLYHDLFGFLLEGSADIGELIDAFDGGAGRDHVQARMRARLPEVETFVDVLCQVKCLVPVDADELAAMADMYPVRAPWAFVVEPAVAAGAAGLIEAVQGRSTGDTPRRVVFSERQAAIWRLVDGERRVRDIARRLIADADEPDIATAAEAAERLAMTVAEVGRVIADWTGSERQWTRCSTVPVSFFAAGRRRPPHLDSTMPFTRLAPGEPVPDDPFTSDGVVDLRRYHREDISDAAEQFELGETTLSYMLRVPHPALGGRTYTAALADALAARGWFEAPVGASGELSMLEVGGGTGDFAAGMLSALSTRLGARFSGLSYRIADISPALQAAQREAVCSFAGRVECLTLDAEELPLPDASVDMLICNEVVADLRTAALQRAAPESAAGRWAEGSAAEAVEVIAAYDLPVDDAPDSFWLNLGAIRFVERVAAVLRPGGRAFISEFGDLWRYPIESTHLDHPEFSIHFGHLRHVAERLGLEVDVVTVPRFIGLDPSVPVMSATRTWFRNLGWWFARRGVRVEKIAYTPAMLRELCGDAVDLNTIPSLRFAPVGDRALGLRPEEFKALLLRKPATPASSDRGVAAPQAD